jgi:hypothetical protein
MVTGARERTTESRLQADSPPNATGGADAYAGGMSALAIVLLTAFVGWVSVVVGGALFVHRRLRRLHRVHPDRPSTAPMTWLVVPARHARMHRRLRNAVRAARLAIPAPTASDPSLSLPQLREQMEQQAVVVDHQVVIASRLGRSQRRRMLMRLEADVTKVEDIAERLVTLDARPAHLPRSGWAAEPPDVVLERIGSQVELLEMARQEIDRIERSVDVNVERSS